jgi:hypothetical protein
MKGFWTLYTSDMPHRHVLLSYGFVWLVQLGYLAFVLAGARRRARLSDDREPRENGH